MPWGHAWGELVPDYRTAMRIGRLLSKHSRNDVESLSEFVLYVTTAASSIIRIMMPPFVVSVPEQEFARNDLTTICQRASP